MDTRRLIIFSYMSIVQISVFIATPRMLSASTVCDPWTCPDNGRCINESGAQRCQCVEGFMGINCDADIDECKQDVPCFHRGICHNTIGSWWCECLDGWDGTEHCEENITEFRKCMPGWMGEWCESTCFIDSDCGVNMHCVVLHNGDNRCMCNVGWSGTACTVDRNECGRRNPCRNSGSCINTPGSFLCACADGWTGTNCERELSQPIITPRMLGTYTGCGVVTCPLNGRCINESGTQRCQCVEGFTGEMCDKDINECKQDDPCFHRGVCHNTIGSWWCECLDGWDGTEHCEENITEVRKCMPGWIGEWCQSNCYIESDCGTHGTCMQLRYGHHRCICYAGWSGIACTEGPDECTSIPCRHSGSCINTPESYVCACVGGWTGTNCETEVNYCMSQPCNNQGNCTSNNMTFTCQCAPGWTGQTCSVDIDECVSSPCTTMGICENTPGSFKCNCANGWQGVNCTDDVDECVIHKCVHVDTCSNTIGSYSCNCKRGWQGDDCNDDVNECDSDPCAVTHTCHNTQGSYACVERPNAIGGNFIKMNMEYVIAGSAGALLLIIAATVLTLLYKYKWKRNTRNRVTGRKYGREIRNNRIQPLKNGDYA